MELVCTVKNVEDHPILWMKLGMGRTKNPVPLSVGTQILSRDSRYKLDLDHAAGTYKLIITNIEKFDGGKYQCQVVTSPEKLVSADVVLKVRTSPVINEVSDPVISQGVNLLSSANSNEECNQKNQQLLNAAYYGNEEEVKHLLQGTVYYQSFGPRVAICSEREFFMRTGQTLSVLIFSCNKLVIHNHNLNFSNEVLHIHIT